MNRLWIWVLVLSIILLIWLLNTPSKKNDGNGVKNGTKNTAKKVTINESENKYILPSYIQDNSQTDMNDDVPSGSRTSPVMNADEIVESFDTDYSSIPNYAGSDEPW